MPPLLTAVPGLALVPMEEAHAGELFRLTVANREHLRRWLPWVGAIQAEGDTARFVRDSLEGARLGLRADFVLGAEGRMVGALAFHTLDAAHASGTIGYWLEAGSCGRGWMTAAARRLVDHGFADLGLNRVEIRVATGNRASQAVCDRLGFVREGVAREAERLPDGFVDLQVNSRLRSEWEDGRRLAKAGGQM